MSTHVDSFWLAPRLPAMCGSATLAIEVSSTSMNVASVTVSATTHWLCEGRHSASGATTTGSAKGSGAKFYNGRAVSFHAARAAGDDCRRHVADMTRTLTGRATVLGDRDGLILMTRKKRSSGQGHVACLASTSAFHADAAEIA